MGRRCRTVFFCKNVGRHFRLSRTSRSVETLSMTNILVSIFAIFLCLVNAAVWTFVSKMPLVGIGWILAAGACVWLQKWSSGR